MTRAVTEGLEMIDLKRLAAVGLLGSTMLIGVGLPAAAAPWDNPLLDPAYVEALRAGKGIYGDDDRIETYQAVPAAQRAAAVTAALVWPQYLAPTGGGVRVIEEARQPLGQQIGLCAGERFAEQPSVAYCSGFLIDQDLLATAGHCLGLHEPASACSELVVVFGFALSGPSAPRLDYPAGDVYRCREVVTHELAQREGRRFDWAVIRLDRPVTGRTPVIVWGEDPPRDEELVVIGHPVGLPTKIAAGGWVKRNAGDDPVFVSDLDTYQGNSGSAVFTLSSIQRGDPEVVGILVAGAEDWEAGASKATACKQSARCSDLDASAQAGQRCAGEEVTKTSWILPAVAEAPEVDAAPVGEAASDEAGLDKLLPGLFQP